MNPISPIQHKVRAFTTLLQQIRADTLALLRGVNQLRESVGRIETRQTESLLGNGLLPYEFRVYSQWGQDGIIQYLIRNVAIKSQRFCEFGVETYQEASTRFLLMHDNWTGLIMDGSAQNMDYVRADEIYWRYHLTARQAFITAENINDLLTSNGMAGEIGLLVVDIDGNDYWVWQAITVASPAIVLVEYNSRFGPEISVTVPYKPDFVRNEAHYSAIYYGASLRALVKLGNSKGYAFVGCNSAGQDAFFVRRDLLTPAVREVSIEQGFVRCQFRETRDQQGQLVFASPENESALLAQLPLVQV